MIASVISKKDDSISGIKRSNRDTTVLSPNSPKAIETNKIFLILMFLYAIRDNPNNKNENIPLPKSNISAISPRSRESGTSE